MQAAQNPPPDTRRPGSGHFLAGRDTAAGRPGLLPTNQTSFSSALSAVPERPDGLNSKRLPVGGTGGGFGDPGYLDSAFANREAQFRALNVVGFPDTAAAAAAAVAAARVHGAYAFGHRPDIVRFPRISPCQRAHRHWAFSKLTPSFAGVRSWAATLGRHNGSGYGGGGGGWDQEAARPAQGRQGHPPAPVSSAGSVCSAAQQV